MPIAGIAAKFMLGSSVFYTTIPVPFLHTPFSYVCIQQGSVWYFMLFLGGLFPHWFQPGS